MKKVKGPNLDLQAFLSCEACRYLNGVAAKTTFRADHIEEADEMATIFTKASEQPNFLYEMQCMWYELEAGSAHFRQKNYGKVISVSLIYRFQSVQEGAPESAGYLPAFIAFVMHTAARPLDFTRTRTCGAFQDTWH